MTEGVAVSRRYSHCGNVLSREGIRGVGDEKTCLSGRLARRKRMGGDRGGTHLAYSTVAGHDTLVGGLARFLGVS